MQHFLMPYPNRGDFNDQVATHSNERSFKCDICGFHTQKRWNYKRHVAIHSKERQFKSHICEYRTQLRKNFTQHVATLSDERPFKCDICEYHSRTRRSLKQHFATHNEERKFKCDICEYRAGTSDSLKKHVTTHNERPFKCDICEYHTKTRRHLKNHVATHSDERPFKCEVCEHRSRTRGDLKKHVATHSDVRPFKCDICEFHSRRRFDLKKHIAIHRDEHPFKCDLCEYRTRFRGNLKVHAVVHSDDEPFKCHSCKYTSKFKQGLKYHIAKHHPVENCESEFGNERSESSNVNGPPNKIDKTTDKNLESDPDEPQNNPLVLTQTKYDETGERNNGLTSSQVTSSNTRSCKYCGYLCNIVEDLMKHQFTCPQNYNQNLDSIDIKVEKETAETSPIENEPESNASMREILLYSSYNFKNEENEDTKVGINFDDIKKCSIILKKLEDLGNYHECYYIRLKEPPFLYEVVKVNLNPVIF